MSSRTLFDEEALAAPSEAKSPKVEELADAIAALSLMEAADLVDVLKTKLNIADVPMMAMGGGGGGGGAAPAEEAPVVAKTEFTIKLESFDAATKIKLIKEVRSLTSLGLKEVRIRLSRLSLWRLVCVCLPPRASRALWPGRCAAWALSFRGWLSPCSFMSTIHCLLLTVFVSHLCLCGSCYTLLITLPHCETG
jgi:large subunit ribosomal protein L7/L12